MEKTNSKKNFIWNTIGLTFNAFNSFFFLIIVKLVNGIDIAGVFTYAFSLSLLFYCVSNYYTRAYQVSDHNNNKFGDYFISRIIYSIIAIVFTLVFSLLSGFDGYKISVIMLLLIFKIIDSLSDCIYALFQSKDELYKAGISYTLKGIIGIGIFLLIDILFKNIIYTIIALIIIDLLIFVLYDLLNYKKYKMEKIKFDKKGFINITIKAFPVFIFSFLAVYLANLPKYVLTYFSPNDIQTVFGIIIMPATMISLVGQYIIMPFLNDFKKLFKNNKIKEVNKKSIKILLALLVIDIVCIGLAYIAGIPVLNFVYNIELKDYKLLLLLILCGAYFNAGAYILSNILTVENENNKQLYTYIIISIISTIISVVLTKYYFINGAVFTYIVSYMLLFISYLLILLSNKKDGK